MRLVVIESPYAGDIEKNMRYLDACMRDCFKRGEAPFASHGLYTRKGVLDDNIPDERSLGMAAGFAWGQVANIRAVYTDLGISSGMKRGIETAPRGQAIEYRSLGPDWGKGGVSQ